MSLVSGPLLDLGFLSHHKWVPHRLSTALLSTSLHKTAICPCKGRMLSPRVPTSQYYPPELLVISCKEEQMYKQTNHHWIFRMKRNSNLGAWNVSSKWVLSSVKADIHRNSPTHSKKPEPGGTTESHIWLKFCHIYSAKWMTTCTWKWTKNRKPHLLGYVK